MNKLLLLIPLIVLSGCASTPVGPSVMVLPGNGKSFDQFQADDYRCRGYATQSSGGNTANQAAENAGVKSAAAGAAIGALAGAALGRSGHATIGGAGLGAAGGALAGTGAASESGNTVQHRYDIAYEQCMYANGNQIPGATRPYSGPASRATQPPPPPPAR